MYLFDDFWSSNESSQYSEHYFNVLLTRIALNPRWAQNILPPGVTKMWDLTQVTDFRPQAYLLHIDQTLDSDTDFEIFREPHQIVFVSRNNEVSALDMIDFQTEDPWEITIEDLYENEDDWEE